MTKALETARVLVVGVGGLGSAAATTLARAGVGTIGLADPDRVELSNLHRQLLHAMEDVGALKVESAARKLSSTVFAHPLAVTEAEVATLFARYDFVIDATDRPRTKFLLNDAAVLLGRPLSHAGAIGFGGQILTIVPGESACLRCVFGSLPADDGAIGCRDAGILGPVAAIVGAIQAHEAIRWFTARGDRLGDRLLALDWKTLRFREIRVRRDPDCPLCGTHASIRTLSSATSSFEE